MDLAHDAATYAAAVAETVQKGHSPVSPKALAGAPAPTDQITPAEATSPIQVHYSKKHVEALTEYVVTRITSAKRQFILKIVQDAERDREGYL